MEVQNIPFDDSNILKAMQNVTNWFLLGVHLKIEQPVLKKISADYGREGTERCKLEMINCWKRHDPTANWQKLKRALRNRNYDLTTAQTDGDELYYTFEPLSKQESTPDTKLRQRTESVVNNPLQPRCCGKHKDPLQYFCNDPSCYQLLCCQCLATGEHSDHDWKELEQAFVSMEARLQQAGQVAKEAAKSARRQMSALRTEEDRLQSKCETAKASIHTNIGDIRSQFDNRKAYFEHNLEHTAQRHNFLKHRKPRESLLAELEALQELSKHGEDVLAGLNSEDTMSLKEVEKTTNRLKKIQDTVTKFQTQCSLRNTKFEANSSQVRVKLSSYGDVKVDTFEQDPYYSSSNEPYEVVSKSKQLRRARSRSLTELNSPEDPQNQFTSKRGYSKMKRPPVPKKPLGIRHESMSGAIRPTRKKGVFVLPPHPSSPTRFALSKNRTFTSRPMSADIGSQSSRNFQEIDEILYDEPFSPPKSFQIPPPPSYPPPLPASQDGAAQYIEVINSK